MIKKSTTTKFGSPQNGSPMNGQKTYYDKLKKANTQNSYK